MSDEWTDFKLRVSGVEELMLELDGKVYKDNDWFAGSALVALGPYSDRYGRTVDEDPGDYEDWVSFRAREEGNIWVMEHNSERVGAEQNLDESVSHACSLPSVDLDPWDP